MPSLNPSKPGRRQFIKTLGAGVAGLAGLSCLATPIKAASKTPTFPKLKNVVVILADDHARKVTGAYGSTKVNTPAIDKLASQGVTFTRSYCNAPICSASRQSLLTGKYPHATGVNLLFTPFPDEGNTTIAEHLGRQQYKSAMIGKTHWNNWVWHPLYKDGLPNHGFDTVIENGEYRDFLKTNPPDDVDASKDYYNKPDPDNVAEWMNWRVLPQPVDDAHSRGTFYANEAIRFMRENRDNPFFLWLAFFEPHHPYYFPVEYAGKYNPDDMPLPDGSPEDDRWIPEKFRKLSDAEKRGIIASYYTSTEYMDKNVGLVLNALKQLDLEDDTLVIYISDNGYLLYEHKRFEKHTMWEEAVRQPMIVRAGASWRAGERSDALVEYIDVLPTITEMIGAPKPTEAQGTSFAPVIRGEQQEHGEYAFSEYLQDNLAMICNKKYKYVFTTGSRDLTIGYATGYGPSGIVHRLYDLENDPREMHSLANDPKYQTVLHDMQRAMLDVFMRTHPNAAQCPQKLTTEGKLVWFCEPRDVGYDQELKETPVRVFQAK